MILLAVGGLLVSGVVALVSMLLGVGVRLAMFLAIAGAVVILLWVFIQ